MTLNSDVDRIMKEIRAEVRRTKAAGDRGERPPGSDGASRSRRFRPCWGGRVQAGQILHYRDEEFVRKAYLALLNRQPEPEGLLFWLRKIRDEGRSRIWVLRMISESQEGRIHNVPIRGLKIRYALHRLAEGLGGVPILGPGLLLFRTLGRMPERVGRLERTVRAGDSAGRPPEEIPVRLGRIEERLDHLERRMRGRAGGQARREPGDKRRERKAHELRGKSGRRA